MRRHQVVPPGPCLLALPALLALLSLFGISGCSRDRITPPEPATEDWSLGESQVHQVAEVPGAKIEDGTSGEIFELPEGGGELTITPILEGPEVGAEDSAFEVGYTGEGPAQLLIVQEADDIDLVLRFVPFDVVIQEGDYFEDGGWIPVAAVEGATDTVRVEILPSAGALARGATSAAPRISKFRRIRIKTTDSYPIKLAQMKANVKLAVDELVLGVADHRRPAVERAVHGDLAYSVHLRERAKISPDALPCYAPFWNDDLRWFVACGLLMIDDSAGSVAHESGHYFHHVLVGTEVFKTFLPRPEGHKLATLGATYNLIEEPAYFAEYYLNGLIGSPATYNPENGSFLIGGGLRPATTNFLDLEGFATALLASLTRSDAEIRDFEGRRVRVPVVDGERIERFQAGFEIFAEGTNSVPAVLGEIRDYLFLNGGQDGKLPAMLEPIGLSYHGKIRFVDEDANGVAGVSVRPISSAEGVTYSLPTNGTTDGSGNYTLPRLFPGQARLRVYHDSDSTEVSYAVDWTIPTQQEINLGTITLGRPQPEITRIEQYDQRLVAGRSTIDIHGKRFGFNEGKILFGDVEAAPLYSGSPQVQWGDVFIKTVIPIDAEDESVTIRTESGEHSEAFPLSYLSIPEFVAQCRYYLVQCTADYTLTWTTPSGSGAETRTGAWIGINPYLYTAITGNGNGYSATTNISGVDYAINTSLRFTGAKPSLYKVDVEYTYSATSTAANPDGSHDSTVITLELKDLPLDSEEQFDFRSGLTNPGAYVERADITVQSYDYGEQVLLVKRLSSISYSELSVTGFTTN